MGLQENDEKIWNALHGQTLKDVFRRGVRGVFHPQGIMRQNVLVFDLMTRFEAEGILHAPETLSAGIKILHDQAAIFEKSPYEYCTIHNVSFAFAHQEVLERLEKFVGHPVDMPIEYAERMSSMLQKIRQFGSSQQIRQAFDL